MKKKSYSKDGNTNLALRLVAGFYLLYSAYSLIRLYAGDADRERWKILFPIIAILFFLVSVYFIISTVRQYHSASTDEQKMAIAPDIACQSAEPGNQPLASAWERVSACVTEHRDILDTFNARGYAAGFSNYRRECGAVFEDAASSGEDGEKIGALLASKLIFELGSQYSAMPKASARAQKDTDKRVMAFYLVPMVCEMNLCGCFEFANELTQGWNQTYPECRFSVGRYEDILAGFHKSFSSILGLH